VLNFIAQIAMGTPMAARACLPKAARKKAKKNEGRCPAQSKPNVIATEAETNEKNSKEK
jgi:hypothetical protein